MKFFPRDNLKSFPCHANIIIGLPSFGNVGQLSLDCVISTLFDRNQLEHLGFLESEFVLPMVGLDRYPHTSHNFLCHSIEVFKMKSNTPIVFVIMRSACVEGEEKQFAYELRDWLTAQLFQSLVILTGADVNDNYMQDFDLLQQDKPFCIFSVEEKESIVEKYPEWNEIIVCSINIPMIKAEREEADNSEPFHYFGGMDIASYLLQKDSQLNIILLGRLSSSAYHLRNSLDLATNIFKVINQLNSDNSFKQIEQQNLRYPHSWNIFFN